MCSKGGFFVSGQLFDRHAVFESMPLRLSLHRAPVDGKEERIGGAFFFLFLNDSSLLS